jgi:hypothetical protein
MAITLNGTTGITNDGGYTGDGVSFADTTPANTLVTTTGGNVGIGTNSPAFAASRNGLVVKGATANGAEVTVQSSADTGSVGLSMAKFGADAAISNRSNGFMAFGTNDITRLFIAASGEVLVGKTSADAATVGVILSQSGQIYGSSAADAGIFYRSTTGAGNGIILTKSDIGGTNNLVGAAFANGTFGAVSDINKKKNIESARSYLDDVMKLRVVKYNWNTDEEGTPKELGWIAQEVEQVFSGMVTEIEGSKLLKKEVFLPMLMKCIQEQQAIITDLKARIEALEAK